MGGTMLLPIVLDFFIAGEIGPLEAWVTRLATDFFTSGEVGEDGARQAVDGNPGWCTFRPCKVEAGSVIGDCVTGTSVVDSGLRSRRGANAVEGSLARFCVASIHASEDKARDCSSSGKAAGARPLPL